MMFSSLALILALSVSNRTVPSPLQVAPEPDALLCANANAAADMAILACTRLLGSGRYDAKGRVAWLSNRGLHEQRSGRLVEAAQDFSDAISLAPENAQLYISRGAAYGTAGQLDKALLDFEKAVALDPNLGVAYMNRATALEKKGRYVESLRDYDKAIVLIPDNWIAWDGRCWLRAIVGQDLDGARTDCERALQIRPDAANTLNTLGFVLFRLGRFKDAIASYNDSILRDPNVASSYYVRGLARQASGEHAGDDLAKALSLEPTIRQRYETYGIDTGPQKEKGVKEKGVRDRN